jgi:hypothetical protein
VRALAREPAAEELEMLRDYWKSSSLESAARRAAVCQAILNLNEFVYLP